MASAHLARSGYIASSPRIHSTAHRKPFGRLPCRATASLPSGATRSPTEAAIYRVPRDAGEQVEQAMNAAKRAHAAGVRRQRMELLLPLIGATDLDDWPGGIRQQFKAAKPLVEQILLGLKTEEGLQGSLSSSILDDGDAVGQWASTQLAAVLFPRADTLDQVQRLVDSRQLVLLFNAQWQGGQVVSDFGLLPWVRRKREELVDTFEEVYSLRQLRILGEDVRLLRIYPGQYQLFAMRNDGTAEHVATTAQRPAYREMETLLRTDRPEGKASMSIADRIRSELKFNAESVKGQD